MVFGTYGGTTNYATDMFETTSHDFGVVVKGSKTEFDFVFTNKYKEDVEILSVTSSCQCTTPSFEPRGVIKSWGKGKIHVSVNTKSFVGNKNATITVRFSKPYYAEVQLHSYVYIRTDVAVEPGVVYFGTVTSGSSPAIAVNINSVKGANWTINDVQSTCGFLSVELKQTARNYGLVSYQMIVHLKNNAPPGNFSEYLELITNDPDSRNSRFLVPVEGRIRQPLSVSPSPLSFGLIEVGETAAKSLVLQGTEPFLIRDITSDDRQIAASINHTPQKVQVVKLLYRADEPRTVNGSITILTDIEDTPQTQVVFNGKIIPKPEPKPEPEPAAPETTEEPQVASPTIEIDEAPQVDSPAENTEEKPTSEPAEKPTESETDSDPLNLLDLNESETKPLEAPAEKPAAEETPAETPVEAPAAQPVEEKTEEKAEEEAETPARETATLEKPTRKIGRNLLKK